MADQTAMPLTDDEREELEALRAEKARRAEEERARVEREELEALRAEQERVDAEILAERAAEERAARKAPAAKDTSSRPAPQPAPTSSPKEKTFGERMVTSNTVDDDGIPTMPVAQKIIIAVALVAVVAFIIYTATR